MAMGDEPTTPSNSTLGAAGGSMNLGRGEHWIALASAVAAAWLFTRPPKKHEPPEGVPVERLAPALAALPAGAGFVVHADLTRVRRSPLGAALTGGGRELAGLGSITEICGFDPTEQIRELALSVPEQRPGAAPTLGIVATGNFDPERFLPCVAKVVDRRGGSPVKNQLGTFSSVRDQSREGPEIAVRKAGPAIVGEGGYFRSMVDAAEGHTPTLLSDEMHSTLRTSVGGAGAITATWISRPGWLERWLQEDEATRAPLRVVRAGALRVDLLPEARATLLLACPDKTACSELGKWADGAIANARAGLTRELGADPISGIESSVEQNAVRLVFGFDSGNLQQVLGRLLRDDGPAVHPPAAGSAAPLPSH